MPILLPRLPALISGPPPRHDRECAVHHLVPKAMNPSSPTISPLQLFVAVAAAPLPRLPAKPLKGPGYARVLMPKITPAAPEVRRQKERDDWARQWLIPSVTSLHGAALAGVACAPSRQLEEAAGLTFEEAVAAAFPFHVAQVATSCSHSWDSSSRYKRTAWETFVSPELLHVTSGAHRRISSGTALQTEANA